MRIVYAHCIGTAIPRPVPPGPSIGSARMMAALCRADSGVLSELLKQNSLQKKLGAQWIQLLLKQMQPTYNYRVMTFPARFCALRMSSMPPTTPTRTLSARSKNRRQVMQMTKGTPRASSALS